jgi:hypothetical protein
VFFTAWFFCRPAFSRLPAFTGPYLVFERITLVRFFHGGFVSKKVFHNQARLLLLVYINLNLLDQW